MKRTTDSPASLFRKWGRTLEHSAHYKYQRLLQINKKHAALYFASKQPDKRICVRVAIAPKGTIIEDNPLRMTCYELEADGCLEHCESREETIRGTRQHVRLSFWKLTPHGTEVLSMMDNAFDDEIHLAMKIAEQKREGELF